MRRFAALVEAIETSAGVVEAWTDWFRVAGSADAMLSLRLLVGGGKERSRRRLTAARLRRLLGTALALPEWLIERSLGESDDAAEGGALLLSAMPMPEFEAGEAAASERTEGSLHRRLERLTTRLDEPESDETDRAIAATLRETDETTRRVLLRALLGTSRPTGSMRAMLTGLGRVCGVPIDVLEDRSARDTGDDAATFERWIAPCAAQDSIGRWSRVPLTMIDALPTDLDEAWSAEWNWVGLRVRLVRHRSGVRWSADDLEPLTGKLPEPSEAAERLAVGTVLDGILIAGSMAAPRPRGDLERRLARRRSTAADRRTVPVTFVAIDLLHDGLEDRRGETWTARRERLEQLFATTLADAASIALSPAFRESCSKLQERHRESRRPGIDGLVLKPLGAPYDPETIRWFVLPPQPFRWTAVLRLVRQTGDVASTIEGSFSVRGVGGEFVPFAQAPLSFGSDEERTEFEALLKRTTIARFGPVRELEPEQVYELECAGFEPAPRRRSGLALRGVRVIRRCDERTVDTIDSLADLQAAWRITSIDPT